MTACIFHDTNPDQQDRRIFDIVEEAYNRREKVLIFSSDGERASAIDRLLWIMKQEAFLPHRIFEKDEPDGDVPIAIVATEMNPIKATLLVADGHCDLDFACKFRSIHEFVIRSTPQLHEACRERYRQYRLRNVKVDYRKS